MKEEDRPPSWSCLGGQSIWRPRRQNHTPYILNGLIFFFFFANECIHQTTQVTQQNRQSLECRPGGIDGILAHVAPNCVHVASVQCHHGSRQIYLLCFHLGGQKMLPSKKKRDFPVIFSHQKISPPFTSVTIFTSGENFKCP